MIPRLADEAQLELELGISMPGWQGSEYEFRFYRLPLHSIQNQLDPGNSESAARRRSPAGGNSDRDSESIAAVARILQV
jgi:hypothetical protein